MELGSEFAKGAAEKVLGVKLPILMRMVLPGLLANGIFYPFVIWLIGHLPSDDDHWWQRIVAFIVLVFLLGATISTLNSELYKIYEGRIVWPETLRKWGVKRQELRIKRLLKIANELAPGPTKDEIWYQLRIYPTDEKNDPQATHPTRLGNTLAGYEQYPRNRYGMDSVFYWPRIWLLVEQEKKEEIDGIWSVADGFLTMSAISFTGGVLWIVQSVGAAVNIGLAFLPLGTPVYSFLGGCVLLGLGFLFYRVSLPFHRDNGETFKSIFDAYRGKVWDITSLKPDEREIWRATWAYLQYGLLLCPNCKTQYNSSSGRACENCGFGLAEADRDFKHTGKFRL